MLEVSNLVVKYDEAIALNDVSLKVNPGEIVCLLGPNGAGKSTLLMTISGVLRPSSGKITFLGKEITRKSSSELVSNGICQVPEGRRIFGSLTVIENMQIGAFTRKKENIHEDIKRMMGLFPALNNRRTQRGGLLSGGEQQMLAFSRALMGKPKLLLLDEPSLGLAPKYVKSVYNVIQEVNRQGTTILLVEQNTHMALEISTRGYVIESGKIITSGTASELKESKELLESYLGR